MYELIESLSSKYQFEVISNALNKLHIDSIGIRIGFIGEFSSGKSTLINALLNRKILPAMDKPTSKSIVEVEPRKDLNQIELYEIKDNISIQISPAKFQDIALGKITGKGLIRIPESELFKENSILVDTPGLASLDDMDVDITFGYLPLLDGAVVCIDIGQGSLTQSILNFFNRKEIISLIDNFVFVLTHADKKGKSEGEKIRQYVIQQIKNFCTDNGIALNNISERVAVISAQQALEKKDSTFIDEFRDAYKKFILSKAENCKQERLKKSLVELAQNFILMLEDRLENVTLDDKELTDKYEELKKAEDVFEGQLKANRDNMKKLKFEIPRALMQIADNYISQYEKADSSAVQTISEEMMTEFSQAISMRANRYFKEIADPILHVNYKSLENQIGSVIDTVEMGKKIATFVIFSSLLPGSGIVKNATEGAIPILVGQVVDDATRQTTETNNKTVPIKILKGISNVIKEINPVEYLGNYIANKIKSKKASTLLPSFVKKAADQAIESITYEVDNTIILPILEKISQLQKSIDDVRREKASGKLQYEMEKKKIKEDIIALKENIIRMEAY